MKNTGQKLILVSFILALIAAIVLFIYLQSLNKPKQEGKNITVLVANEAIPARTLIEKKMIKEIKVQDDPIFSEYIKDSSKIVGKYSKETILKNEGFYSDNLLDRNSNELSIRINKNYRAISINVTGENGVSDLIKPEDYVDVITFVSEKKDGMKTVRPDIAKIILQNIKVMAVDKVINRNEKNDNADDAVKDAEKISVNFLVTLAVPKANVEKLVLAENIGNVKLVLRSIDDRKTIQTSGTTWKNLADDKSGGADNQLNNEDSKAEKGVTYKIDSAGKTDSEAKKNTADKAVSNSKNSGKYKKYTVKRNDTLRKISKKFYNDESKYTIIKSANNIKDEDVIETNQVIKIPVLQK